jgi:hypothetical protein
MIPGGYAGLKCVRQFASRTGYKLDKELSAGTLEAVMWLLKRETYAPIPDVLI